MEAALLEARQAGSPEDSPPRTPMRWLVLLAFSLVTACNGLVYATEAAVEVPAEDLLRLLWLWLLLRLVSLLGLQLRLRLSCGRTSTATTEKTFSHR